MQEEPATIKLATVDKIVGAIPRGDWKRLDCWSLPPARARGRWRCLETVEGKGGNYAFLMPVAIFEPGCRITLHGPKRSGETKTSKIPFSFGAAQRQPLKGMMVVYVGKTANLAERLRLHVSATTNRTTTAQVRWGLEDAGLGDDRPPLHTVLAEAVVLYHKLDGDEHVANRDLVEYALCARYAPPFNIKSEH